MTYQEAYEIALRIANEYVRHLQIGNFEDFKSSEAPWFYDWYNYKANGSLSGISKRLTYGKWENSVKSLAKELVIRNSRLYKALQEEE